MKHYDIIIIGTGAGGSTLAYKLSRTGKKILILERGDFLPKEVNNWNPVKVAKGKYRPKEKWLDKNNGEFSPYTHYWIGGNTKMYGAALLRMRESDFGEVKHYGGVSPAWPLTYDDFAPYYQEAEELYKVHGRRGIDPTEAPSSKPYPYPPLRYEPNMKEMASNLKKLGLHPTPIPIGVSLPKDKKRKNARVKLSLFDGYPDPTESKADAHVVALNKAIKKKNVKLKTNHTVQRIDTDRTGKRATEVVCTIKDGKECRYSADIIVVSCGAINSAKLLLQSKSDLHPQGLANSSGMVGRNLMLHNNGTVVAISKKPNTSKFQKAFLIPDFYNGADDSKLPLGTIQLMGKTDPVTLKDELKQINPDKEFDVADVADHSIDFFITAEDLPDLNNRVEVTDDGRTKLVYNQNNEEAYQRLRKKLVSLLGHIGCTEGYCKDNAYVGFKLGISGVSHQNGTCKFGTDPKKSVLDLDCKAHDLDNLYVVDGSFFPSSSAVNPSLTIIANALRVGDSLSKNIKR
ncbi:MAG: GMC family oxidoreductase [Bacteroidota bacterium]